MENEIKPQRPPAPVKFRRKYPFSTMQIGEWFEIDLAAPGSSGMHSAARNAGIKISTTRNQGKLIVRRVG